MPDTQASRLVRQLTWLEVVEAVALLAALGVLLAEPWMIHESPAEYCLDSSTRRWGIDHQIYYQAIYLPTVMRFAVTGACLWIATWASRGVPEGVIQRRGKWYFWAAFLLSAFGGPLSLYDFCYNGEITQFYGVLSGLSLACTWSWQVGTTLLLHEVVIAKVRVQKCPTRLLSVVVKLQCVVVAIYTCDTVHLALDFQPRLAANTARAFWYYVAICVCDAIFTVRSTMVLAGQFLAARRALLESVVGSAEQKELSVAVWRFKLDFATTVAATTTGTVYYLAALINLQHWNSHGLAGAWAASAATALFWCLVTDSATNDLLILVLMLLGTKTRGHKLEHALSVLGQTAEEQKQRDRDQQNAFLEACEALQLADMSDEALEELVILESHVREAARLALESTPAWQQLRALCSDEQSRLGDLTRQAVEAYEILQGRMGFALKIQGPQEQPQQPGPLPADPVAAIQQLRREGQRLQPEFARRVARLTASFNAAEFPKDLGLDSSVYMLAMDQSHVLPRPPKKCKLALFPITGSDQRLQRSFLYAPREVKKDAACLRKVRMDYSSAAQPVSFLCDIVRLTVIFADPYHLAMFFAYVQASMQVIRVKNRFLEPLKDSEYRDIMLNLMLEVDGIQQVVEMQLVLEILFALKSYQHKPYAVLRYENMSDFAETKIVFLAGSPDEDAFMTSSSNSCDAVRSPYATEGFRHLGTPGSQTSRLQERLPAQSWSASRRQEGAFLAALSELDTQILIPPLRPENLSQLSAMRPEIAQIWLEIERVRLEQFKVEADVQKAKLETERVREKLKVEADVEKEKLETQRVLEQLKIEADVEKAKLETERVCLETARVVVLAGGTFRGANGLHVEPCAALNSPPATLVRVRDHL